MRTLKLAFLSAMGLLTLAACSNTFGAAPFGPDGQYMSSGQQYQDYTQATRENPNTAWNREHGW